jgi:hypothetical protein
MNALESVQLIKAAMPKVTQRAIADSLGVSPMTVNRDLETNVTNEAAATTENDTDSVTNVTTPELSGADVAKLGQHPSVNEHP